MKQFQVLIILLLLLVISIVYLFSTTDVVVVKNGGLKQKNINIPKREPVDLKKLELDYKNDVLFVFKEIELLFADSRVENKNVDFSKKADIIKDKLVKAVVPSDEYKKLHIDLVLLLRDINSNFIDKSIDKEKDINKKIEEIKIAYSWIGGDINTVQ